MIRFSFLWVRKRRCYISRPTKKTRLFPNLLYACKVKFGPPSSISLPINFRSKSWFISSLSGNQSHHQRFLLPQRVNLLIIPIPTLRHQLQIEIPQNLRKNKSHLRIRKTTPISVTFNQFPLSQILTSSQYNS